MKFIFIPLIALGLAAGVFGLITLTGGQNMNIEDNDTSLNDALPLIDTETPGRIETATFALG